ncbi:uncharacterized protein LOC127724953 [Mytilus californianus]|uniref:uncharacterized protein LOC127724953 n=1 Tax=Mytilus californianus TaxID=6549 RepID=UPI002245AA41|nr:uncharacterized protein LOC127724953 [Mytilus californianus]
MTEERFQRKLFHILFEVRDLMKSSLCSKTASLNCEFETAESLEELEAIESALENIAKQNNLREYLRRIGGVDFKDLLKKAMTRMMSNSVMSKMNMKGKKNKVGFVKTKLYRVISGCVMNAYPEITETQLKEELSKFLKYAPERAGGGGRERPQ